MDVSNQVDPQLRQKIIHLALEVRNLQQLLNEGQELLKSLSTSVVSSTGHSPQEFSLHIDFDTDSWVIEPREKMMLDTSEPLEAQIIGGRN